MKISVWIPLVAALSVSACAVPGSQLSVAHKQVITQEDARFDLDKMVDIYPITPLLLQRLNPPAALAQPNPHLNRQMAGYQYTIGAGDVLNIIVWDHPELTSPVVVNQNSVDTTRTGSWVDPQGNIFYPYVGKIHVAGLTLAQVRQLLTNRLAQYIRHPQVDVNISAFRAKKVYVSGAVGKPSQLPITNVPLTVLDAVNQAGGLLPNADSGRIRVTHNGADYTLSLRDLMQQGDMSQNLLLSNGDVVHVPSNDNQKVYVMGEIGRQQTLKMDESGMNLTEALGNASGINQDMANATGVFVIRAENHPDTGKVARIYQLNLSDASAYALGTQFKLQPQDVVYVTATPLTRWNRLLGQIMPTILGISNLATGASNLKGAGVYR